MLQFGLGTRKRKKKRNRTDLRKEELILDSLSLESACSNSRKISSTTLHLAALIWPWYTAKWKYQSFLVLEF